MTTETNTQAAAEPTSEELRQRRERVTAMEAEALETLARRKKELNKQHAHQVETVGKLPAEAHREVAELEGNWQALIEARERLTGENTEAEESERVALVLETHDKALQEAAHIRDLAQEEQAALEAFASKYVARRRAQERLLHLTRRAGPSYEPMMDKSWRELYSNEHSTHVINVTLAMNVGSQWHYERLSPFGNDPTLVDDVRTASVRALHFLTSTHGVHDVPGVAEAADEAVGGAPAGVPRQRMQGTYAGSRRAVDAE